jgi:hypothetical protein
VDEYGCIVEEPEGCEVCLCGHDDDIHAATLSIHGWMRQQVTKWLCDPDEIPLDDDPIEYFVLENAG